MTWGLNSKTNLPLGTRPAGSPIAPALSGTIKVMAIGDSITVGLGDGGLGVDDQNGYRLNLHNLMTASGVSLEWVGSENSGDAPSDDHNGFSGSTTVDHVAAGTHNTPADIVTYDPDVCIVFLGTNDANDATLTTNFATNYDALMDEFEAAKAGMRYVVCTIPRCGGEGSDRWENIPTLNAALPGIWDTLDGSMSLVRCDLRVLTHWSDYDRGEGTFAAHPGANGYIKLAHALFPAFRNACGLNAVW